MEQKPQWLKDIHKMVSESNLKIQELEEAIKNINYDKGMQLTLNPPGYGNTGKSFRGNQMEHFYRQQIKDIRSNTWEKVGELKEQVNVQDLEKYREELNERLHLYEPKDKEARHLKNQKSLDNSQAKMEKQVEEHKSSAGEKEKLAAKEQKPLSLEKPKEENPIGSFRKNLLFTKMQENKKKITEKEITDVNPNPPGTSIDIDRE
ncbi:MAG: hypothetical protein IPJ79_18630 [Bacteroidetes bacterium]|nr:hypothetical protein [Bacteroidota bacterium]